MSVFSIHPFLSYKENSAQGRVLVGIAKKIRKDLEIRNKSCILVTSNNLDIVSESKARGVFLLHNTYLSPLAPLKQTKSVNKRRNYEKPHQSRVLGIPRGHN